MIASYRGVKYDTSSHKPKAHPSPEQVTYRGSHPGRKTSRALQTVHEIYRGIKHDEKVEVVK